jgi:hypothetical protein
MLEIILVLILSIIIVTMLVFATIGIIKGYNGKSVFFYSWWDLVRTSILVVTAFAGLVLLLSSCAQPGNLLLGLAAGIVLFLSLYFNAIVPFRLNQSKWDAVCVFCGRLVIGLFGLVLLSGLGYGCEGKRHGGLGLSLEVRRANALLTWAVLAYLFSKLAKRLVNGKEVEHGDRVFK